MLITIEIEKIWNKNKKEKEKLINLSSWVIMSYPTHSIYSIFITDNTYLISAEVDTFLLVCIYSSSADLSSVRVEDNRLGLFYFPFIFLFLNLVLRVSVISYITVTKLWYISLFLWFTV